MIVLALKRMLRILWRHPGLALAIILTAAIGIGSGVGVFTYMDALLFKPLPFRTPERLVRLSGVEPQIVNIPFSGPDLEDIRAQTSSLEEVIAYDNYAKFDLITSNEALHIPGAAVSPNFFQFLGTTPLRGRTFLPSEGDESRSAVVVLSYKFWQQQFGGDPKVLGSMMNMNGKAFEVVGVLPEEFWFPGMQQAMLWVPLSRKPSELNSGDMSVRNNHWLKVVSRLRTGVTLAQAQSELDRISSDLQRLYPESNHNLKWVVEPLRNWINEDTKAVAPGLLAVGMLIIISTCANIAVLVLLRIATRRMEMATQLALGANKLHVYGEEAGNLFILSLMGGIAGTVLSYIVIKAMPIRDADTAPLLQNLTIDHRILLVFAFLIISSSALAGWVATAGALKNDWMDALRSHGFGKTSVSTSRKLQKFVACQVAMATALIIGATTLCRSLAKTAAIDPGFDSKHMLTMEMDIVPPRYNTIETRLRFIEALLDRIRATPGIQAAGVASFLPFGGLHGNGRFSIAGSDNDKGWSGSPAEHNIVGPDFFKTMGIPIFAGRDFTENDGMEPVVIVSASLADTYFKAKDPIGSYLKLEGLTEEYRIVGVAGNVKRVSLGESPLFYIYFPYAKYPTGTIFLVARTQDDPLHLVSSIKTAIRNVDSMQPVSNIMSMEDRVLSSLSGTRFNAGFVGACAGLALVLAIVAIYSTVSYIVATRTQEIGIRMAMGAEGKHLMVLLLKKMLVYIAGGVIIGVICVLFLRVLLHSWTLVAVPIDPALVCLSCFGTFLTAIIAALLPARRAAHMQPSQALRTE